jgi:hypothetical protein
MATQRRAESSDPLLANWPPAGRYVGKRSIIPDVTENGGSERVENGGSEVTENVRDVTENVGDDVTQPDDTPPAAAV